MGLNWSVRRLDALTRAVELIEEGVDAEAFGATVEHPGNGWSNDAARRCGTLATDGAGRPWVERRTV